MIDVERVDYVRVPVTGHGRGQPLLRRGAGPRAEPELAREDWVEYEVGNVTLAVMTPHTHDYEFSALPLATIALRA